MKLADVIFGAVVVGIAGVWLIGVGLRSQSCGSHGGGIRILSWREYIRGWRRGEYAPPWRRW